MNEETLQRNRNSKLVPNIDVHFKFTQPICGGNPQAKKLTENTVSKPVKLVRTWQRQTWNHSEGMPPQPSPPRAPKENNPYCRCKYSNKITNLTRKLTAIRVFPLAQIENIASQEIEIIEQFKRESKGSLLKIV